MPQICTSSAVDGQPPAKRHVRIRTALLTLVAALAVALTLPAAGTAAAPNQRDKLKARGSCADERGLTRARHQRFRLKYGRRAFNRCVKIKARRYARRRGGGGGGGMGGLPGMPGLPTIPGMPGMIEMPGVRLECQMAQMEDPIGFMQEYPALPGSQQNPIEMCVMMESMP
jgi:hypothetical protein